MSHAFHRRAALRTLLSLLGASLPALASTRAPRTEPIRLALIESLRAANTTLSSPSA